MLDVQMRNFRVQVQGPADWTAAYNLIVILIAMGGCRGFKRIHLFLIPDAVINLK